MDVQPLADAIDAELRTRGTPERALHEKAYLKSQLEHYGTSVPAVRAVAKGFASPPLLRHDDLIALVDELWARRVHECRMVTVELLDIHVELLGPADADVIERFLRGAGTWALVDGLSSSVMGKLVDRYAELGAVLDRWAVDDDFWIRASGVTIREAVKPLSESQRSAVIAASSVRGR